MTDWIQLGILVVAIVAFYFTNKWSSKKAMSDMVLNAVAKATQDVKQKALLEERIALLEQKQDINDEVTAKELKAIKEMLNKIFNKLDEHIEKYHSRKD